MNYRNLMIHIFTAITLIYCSPVLVDNDCTMPINYPKIGKSEIAGKAFAAEAWKEQHQGDAAENY